MLRRFTLLVLIVCFSLFPTPYIGSGLIAAATARHPRQLVDFPVLQPAATDQAQASIWTRWQPNQYALADDGQALWIGASVL